MAGRNWTLSAERSKNKRPNLIPLVGEAFEILERRKKNGGAHVFGGARSAHLSANRLSIVLRRACKRLQRLKIAYFTPHDLRRTVETGMAAARVPKEYRDRVLNHLDGSVGGVHYNLYDYELEKKSALEAWALRLGTLLTPASNVLPLRRAG
jgi:integrase